MAADALPHFSGGDGSKDRPWLISNAEDLAAIAERIFREAKTTEGKSYSAGYFLQVADIDLSLISSWLPIGSFEGLPFSGVYDGGGYTISSIKFSENIHDVKSQSFKAYGLFGVVSGDGLESGILRNINIKNSFSNMCFVETRFPQNFGSLVGYASNAKIENCNVTCSEIRLDITGLNEFYDRAAVFIGALVGDMEIGTIAKCTNAAALTVSSDLRLAPYIGGIAGRLEGDMFNCSNEGKVTVYGPVFTVGGIIGQAGSIYRNYSGKSYPKVRTICNSNNYGQIKITQTIKDSNLNVEASGIGGLIGVISNTCLLNSNNYSLINICYINRALLIGGLVGQGKESWVNESMNSGDISIKFHYKNLGEPRYVPTSESKTERFAQLVCGGVTGIFKSGELINSTNSGNINTEFFAEGLSPRLYLGGIVGLIDSEQYLNVKFLNLLNIGLLRVEKSPAGVSQYIGGIVGFSNDINVIIDSSCYWLKNPDSTRYGVAGGKAFDRSIMIESKDLMIDKFVK